MSTASIPPEKLALFGALAIGGYWFMTRSAAAGGMPRLTPASLFNRNTNISPARAGQGSPAIYGLANDIGRWIGNAVSGTRAPGYTVEMAGAPHPTARDSAPYSAWESGWPSSTDTVAANPAPQYGSVYDYTQESWY